MEKRREARVKQPYVIRFRQITPPLAHSTWDVASSLNISKTGICFNSSQQFEEGAQLELKMSNPILKSEGVYKCTVIRSESTAVNIFYKTVVVIDTVDKELKEALHKAIDLYIEKQTYKY